MTNHWLINRAQMAKEKPQAKILTMRRMVEKSSTIRMRMFLFKAEFLCCSVARGGRGRIGGVGDGSVSMVLSCMNDLSTVFRYSDLLDISKHDLNPARRVHVPVNVAYGGERLCAD